MSSKQSYDDDSDKSDSLICGFGPRRGHGESESIDDSTTVGASSGDADVNKLQLGGDKSSQEWSRAAADTIGATTTNNYVSVQSERDEAEIRIQHMPLSVSVPTKTGDSSPLPRRESNRSVGSEGGLSMVSEDTIVVMTNLLENSGGGMSDEDANVIIGRIYKKRLSEKDDEIPFGLEINTLEINTSSMISPPLRHRSVGDMGGATTLDKSLDASRSRASDGVLAAGSKVEERQPTSSPSVTQQHLNSAVSAHQNILGKSLPKSPQNAEQAITLPRKDDTGNNMSPQPPSNQTNNEPIKCYTSGFSAGEEPMQSRRPSSGMELCLDVIEENEIDESTAANSILKSSQTSKTSPKQTSQSAAVAFEDIIEDKFPMPTSEPLGEHAKSMEVQLEMVDKPKRSMPAKTKSKRTLEKEQCKGRLAIVSRDTDTQYVKRVVEKSDEEKRMIRDAIATNVLLKACSEEELEELVEVIARRNGGGINLANDNRRVPPPPTPPRNKNHNGRHHSNRSHHSLGSQSTQTTYTSSSTDNDNGRLSNKSNGRSQISLCSSSNIKNNTNHHRLSGPDLGHHRASFSRSRNSCKLFASDDDQDGHRRSYENRSFDRSDDFGRQQNYSHHQRQQQQQQQCYHSHSSGGSRASAASNSNSSRDCSIDYSHNSKMLVPTGLVFERRFTKRLLPTLPSSGALSWRMTSSQETSSYDHYFQQNSQKSPSDIIIANMTRYPQIRRRIRLWHKQKIAPYWKLTVAQLFCVVYILVLTFSPMPVGMKDPITNDIIDVNSEENTRNGLVYLNDTGRAVVAMGGWQKFCLAMSRMSAFSMYPMLVSVFLTKMKALQIFLSNTPLSMYFGVIKEGHDHHVHAGKYIAFDVWIHTIFHCLRWLSQGNINLLWQTRVGITGIVTLIVTPLIAFPMLYYKRKLTYEVRKALHYLFYVFAIAMCFHVPPSAIPNGGFLAPILGSCIVLYALDATYVYIYLSEKVETTSFHVLSSGVRISMPVSDRFQKQKQRSGFAYICIPWINDKQWHPFSLFEDPSDPSTQQMFLMKTGDWTNAVHASLSRDTTRPCWMKGPFPSPYSHASMYDNQILVASGIGITPALAAINAFKCSRLINLIWAVRDPEMLEFFLDHMYLEHGGWNLIFYTGKKQLTLDAEEWSNNHSSNCRIVKGRPQLSYLIPNIIFGNEYEDETFSLWEQSEEQNKGVKGLHDDIMKSFVRKLLSII